MDPYFQNSDSYFQLNSMRFKSYSHMAENEELYLCSQLGPLTNIYYTDLISHVLP